MNLSQNRISVYLIALFLGVAFTDSNQIEAQLKQRKQKTVRKTHRMNYLPRGFNKVRHKNKNYFYRRGLFYNKSGKNYRFVKGPFGFRIKHLPIGFSLVYFSGQPFYYYYGNYYRFDPLQDVYIICKKPGLDDNSDFNHQSNLDEIQLVSGKIYHGYYLGGNEQFVRFKINNLVKKIPLEQIISINYGSSTELEGN